MEEIKHGYQPVMRRDEYGNPIKIIPNPPQGGSSQQDERLTHYGLEITELDRWKYVRTEETIIGMNEETGELKKFKVYCCPKCGAKITDWMLVNAEPNYCSRCGNRNYEPDCTQ